MSRVNKDLEETTKATEDNSKEIVDSGDGSLEVGREFFGAGGMGEGRLIDGGGLGQLKITKKISNNLIQVEDKDGKSFNVKVKN